MKIKLNRFPYICPVLEDHTGEKNGQYIFNEAWYGYEFDVEVIEDNNDRWILKIPTYYEQNPGWLKCEIIKECFDIVE